LHRSVGYLSGLILVGLVSSAEASEREIERVCYINPFSIAVDVLSDNHWDERDLRAVWYGGDKLISPQEYRQVRALEFDSSNCADCGQIFEPLDPVFVLRAKHRISIKALDVECEAPSDDFLWPIDEFRPDEEVLRMPRSTFRVVDPKALSIFEDLGQHWTILSDGWKIGAYFPVVYPEIDASAEMISNASEDGGSIVIGFGSPNQLYQERADLRLVNRDELSLEVAAKLLDAEGRFDAR
tara:strand:+ start:90 stop:809 length:720 start_codon:yes stop_codon:yes gene_type:complete